MSTAQTVRTATIRQRVTIPASPEAVYEALTNARLHAAFTRCVGDRPGARRISVYCVGRLHRRQTPCAARGRLIVQEWSTSEWPNACSASRTEFRLKPAKTGTQLIMIQSGVPAAQNRNLRSGWTEYYWKPLRAWLAKRR